MIIAHSLTLCFLLFVSSYLPWVPVLFSLRPGWLRWRRFPPYLLAFPPIHECSFRILLHPDTRLLGEHLIQLRLRLYAYWRPLYFAIRFEAVLLVDIGCCFSFRLCSWTFHCAWALVDKSLFSFVGVVIITELMTIYSNREAIRGLTLGFLGLACYGLEHCSQTCQILTGRRQWIEKYSLTTSEFNTE